MPGPGTDFRESWLGEQAVGNAPIRSMRGFIMGRNVALDMPSFLKPKVKPGLPEVKAQPQAWPRLDPGAALCRTEADLARLAARRSGDDTAGPADCRIISIATAVTIVQRKGPGRTEVQVGAPANVTGWTDVWLPEKAPASARAIPASQR
jgi:hypothetical protein